MSAKNSYAKSCSHVLNSKEEVLKYLSELFFIKWAIKHKNFNVKKIKKGIYKDKYIVYFKSKKRKQNFKNLLNG